MCSQNAEIHLKSMFLGNEIEIVSGAGCNGTYYPFEKCQQISHVLASVAPFSWIRRQPGCTAIMPGWSKPQWGDLNSKSSPSFHLIGTAQHSKVIFLLKAFYWLIPTIGWMKRIVFFFFLKVSRFKWCNSSVFLTPPRSALGALRDFSRQTLLNLLHDLKHRVIKRHWVNKICWFSVPWPTSAPPINSSIPR